MSSTPVSPTLRALVGRPALALHVVVEDSARLDRPLRGVHSSDLADPTPFLSDDLLLLTTGRQFAGWPDDAPGYEEYVARLDERGIAGLGFGTEVLRAGIPSGLATACERHGMPLVEVPYETPFIALARANAEAIAAQSYARRTWALDAQRALALAALEVEGITATIAELARQLEGWAALFDASGALVREHPPGLLDRPSRAAASARAGDLLRRGTPGAAALSATRDPGTASNIAETHKSAGSDPVVADLVVSVQTLGRGGHLRGALAVAAPALDDAARGVLTSAVGMLGLALEQRHALARTQTRLRAGLLQALLAGQRDLVDDVAGAVWGHVPKGSVVVSLVTGAAAHLSLAADVLGRHPGPVFFGPLRDESGALGARALGPVRGGAERSGLGKGGGGRQGGPVRDPRSQEGLVLVTPAGDRSAVHALAGALPVRIGMSRPTEAASHAALDEARTAASAVRDDTGVAEFEQVAGLDLLTAGGAASRALAAARLAPVTAHDDAHGTALAETLRAWFAADCANEQAAVALGVHRHTVRARLAHIERLLDRDLGSFAVRADLWAALRLTA